MAKIWIDDVRSMPPDYDIWLKTVDDAKKFIIESQDTLTRLFQKAKNGSVWDADDWLTYRLSHIEFLDLDHDAGDYAKYGGDYIRLLDWLEEKQFKYPIKIHTMNVVARQNMIRICDRNGWVLLGVNK